MFQQRSRHHLRGGEINNRNEGQTTNRFQIGPQHIHPARPICGFYSASLGGCLSEMVRRHNIDYNRDLAKVSSATSLSLIKWYVQSDFDFIILVFLHGKYHNPHPKILVHLGGECLRVRGRVSLGPP